MIVDNIETDDYTTDELVLTRSEWQFKMEDIIAQLKQDKERYNEGEESDPVWLNNARLALRVTKLNAKKLDVAIKQKKIEDDRQRKEKNRIRKEAAKKAAIAKDRHFERIFFQVVKETFGEKVFQELISQTYDRMPKDFDEYNG